MCAGPRGQPEFTGKALQRSGVTREHSPCADRRCLGLLEERTFHPRKREFGEDVEFLYSVIQDLALVVPLADQELDDGEVVAVLG